MAHPAHKMTECPVMGCSECVRLDKDTIDWLARLQQRVKEGDYVPAKVHKRYTAADLDRAVAEARCCLDGDKACSEKTGYCTYHAVQREREECAKIAREVAEQAYRENMQRMSRDVELATVEITGRAIQYKIEARGAKPKEGT